jgi:hypothetical protein
MFIEDSGLKLMPSHEVITSECTLVTNATPLEELRKRFEASTGPGKNVGGAR